MELPLLALLVGVLALTSAQAQLWLGPPALTPRAVQEIAGGLATLQRCRGATGATDDDLQALRRQQVPTSRSGKCFVACMGKEYGVLRGAQGQTHVDEVRAQQLLTEVLTTVTENVRVDPNLAADVQAEVSNLIQVCGQQVRVYSSSSSDQDECELAGGVAQCGFQEGRAIRARLRQQYGGSNSRARG